MLKRFMFIPAIWFVVFVFWALPAVAEMIVDTAWVRRYNGPLNWYDFASAIAVDDFGNVYVAGGSGGEFFDYATIKYDARGNELWVQRYDGPANSYDEASDIAVNGSGHVYVTGWSRDVNEIDYCTIKYNTSGSQLWVERYDGPGGNYQNEAFKLAVDDSDCIYVTGFSCITTNAGCDYATIKYYGDGDTAWVRRYDNLPTGDGDGRAITVDKFGCVYVTGRSMESWPDYDCITLKYYPNGDTAWVRRYNGPDSGCDIGSDITVDSYGNVYVAGRSENIGSAYDYLTIKYYSNGDTAWVRTHSSAPNDYDQSAALAVDHFGNTYVTGTSGTVKYDTDGNLLWVKTFAGVDIALDTFDNAYIAGGSPDYVTICYRPNGDTAWVRTYDGPIQGIDNPQAIAVDYSGNVYVTGGSSGNGTHQDYATVKYYQALRGDVNRDRMIDLGDVADLINYLYKNGLAPNPLVVGDCNCSGAVELGDAVYLITYLYKGGPAPNC